MVLRIAERASVGLPDRIRQNPEGAYVCIALAWSWVFWIPALLSFKGILGLPISWLPLLFLGAPGPSISALVVTGVTDRSRGVKGLLRRLVIWRVHPIWYLVAWAGPSLVLLLAMPIEALRGGSVGEVDLSRWPLLFTSVLLAVPYGPLNEELGWRGFLFPRLAAKYGLLVNGVLLGTVWLTWHAPLFWLPGGASISGAPVTVAAVIWYLVYLIAWAVVFGWLFLRSGGSVLLAILTHASLNARSPFALFPDLSQVVQRDLVLWSIMPLGLAVAALLGMRDSRSRPSGPATP